VLYNIGKVKYWQNYWKSKQVPRNWSHMISSYNGGFKATLDNNYLKLIKQKIRILKMYMKKENK